MLAIRGGTKTFLQDSEESEQMSVKYTDHLILHLTAFQTLQ